MQAANILLYASVSACQVDIPAFDWPAAPFPRLRYPLSEFESENRAEEQRCLARVEEIIEQWESKSPVAAVVVEPVQAEGRVQ